MALTIDEVADQAMQLPASARAQLAERIVESLDTAAADEIQRAWIAEVIRRRDDVRSGRVRAISSDQVLAGVRRAVG